ncbi:hypothetical protein C9I98_17805 [Photobacterium sanctipauli]|uniref:Uncharacterized protein n=1 Tax=Photobacterium sanctipauli TaxID=1342794 RepID=A0A2T3NPT1_9GAMM|nr:hypothetical protein [Photobacterium sanctipauli]PSW18232.1 hypothetical protein C9I98_17805 [Photobacterium sanctipauli]
MDVKLIKHLTESSVCIFVLYFCFHWLMTRYAGEFYTDLLWKFYGFYFTSAVLFITLEVLQYYRSSSWGYLAYAFATIAIITTSFEPNILSEGFHNLIIAVGFLGFLFGMLQWWNDVKVSHDFE